MNLNHLAVIVFATALTSAFTASAHDSHTHKAPWQACEEKQKSDQCSFTNGDDDLFKGTCQSFKKTLMCVRNQPIIHAEDLVKKTKEQLKH